MGSGVRVATAVVVGYALGRTRRMKTALTVGGILMGRRLGSDSKGLLGRCGELMSSSPELRELRDTLQERLLDAAKTAATAAASNRIDSLGADLSERAARVRQPQQDGDTGERSEESAAERETSEDERARQRPETREEGEPPRRPSGERSHPPRPRQGTGTARKSAAGRMEPSDRRAGTGGTARRSPTPRPKRGGDDG